jgi:cytochrome P450 family 110
MKLLTGPQSLSFIQLMNWIFRPLDFLEECASKYGDTFNLNLMGIPPFTVVSNPQGIQEILSVDAQKFDVGKTNNLASSLLGDNSLVLLDGSSHRRQRKLMMPPFHGEKVKSYAQTICQITEKIANQWQINQSFTAQKAMQNITFETILHVVFGLSEGERYQQIKPLLIELLDLTGSPLKASVIFLPWLQQDLGEWSPWGKVVRRKRKIYELLQAEIDERRANPELLRDDVLSLMMCAVDEEGQGLSDIELKDQMMTLLVAGHETTATSLAWALYWIHKLPQVKEKLLAELDGFEEHSDSLALARLPYLTAVCNETLRIYPVAFIAFLRCAKVPVEVMGHQFAPETMLAPAIYLTHYREDLYPEAKKFKPERFLERQYSPYEFLPFGGGNRRCIGYALALLEMKLVLATVLTKYDLILASDRPIVPKRRGATVAPHNGVPLRLRNIRKPKGLVNSMDLRDKSW